MAFNFIADFEQASFRQYQRLTKQHKPDMQEYVREKEKLYVSFTALNFTSLSDWTLTC